MWIQNLKLTVIARYQLSREPGEHTHARHPSDTSPTSLLAYSSRVASIGSLACRAMASRRSVTHPSDNTSAQQMTEPVVARFDCIDGQVYNVACLRKVRLTGFVIQGGHITY